MKNTPEYFVSLADFAQKVSDRNQNFDKTLAALSAFGQSNPEAQFRLLFTQLPARKENEYDLVIEDEAGTYVMGFRPKSNLPWVTAHARHDVPSKEEGKELLLFRIDDIQYDGRTVLRMLEYATRTEGISFEMLENHFVVLTLMADQPEKLGSVIGSDRVNDLILEFREALPGYRHLDCNEWLRQASRALNNRQLVLLAHTILSAIKSTISDEDVSNYIDQHQEEFEMLKVMQWSSIESESLTALRKEFQETPRTLQATTKWFLENPKSRKAETTLFRKTEFTSLVGVPPQSLTIGAMFGPFQVSRTHRLYQITDISSKSGTFTKDAVHRLLTQKALNELKVGLPIEWYLDRESLTAPQSAMKPSEQEKEIAE